MTQCTAGSTKQASAPVYFQFDTTTVANFLPFGSAIAYLGFLGLPTGPVDTAQFCSLEPPDTTLSAADILLLGVPVIAKLSGAYTRLANYIQQQAFATYCICNPVTAAPYSTQILSLNPYWYFKLGDAVGSAVILDSSGNGRNGTAGGVTTFGQPALMTGDPATSVLVTSGVGLARNTSAAAERWSGSASSSMEFFANVATPAALAALYDTYFGTNPFISIYVTATGKCRIQARDSANVLIDTTGTATVGGTGVHQYDLVLDAAAHTLKLYIDGAVDISMVGLSTNAYMDVGAAHRLSTANHSGVPIEPATLGHWSFFNGTALPSVTISDNRAASGNHTPYTGPIYTAPADGTPPTQTAPVCASYQDICNQLQITDYLLQGVSIQLTEFSKRADPTIFLNGTAHAGLTGSGTLAVQDIVGLHVSVTSVPSTWGSTAETPRRLIPSVGSIQSTFSGTQVSDNHQVHYEDEILMLASQWATGIRYNFRPGVTATLTELLPGA